MDLVEKNEDYKLKKKDLIEENREDENIYEYELNEKATITTISCEGGGGATTSICMQYPHWRY